MATVIPTDGVILTLTTAEARTLVTVLAFVGGPIEGQHGVAEGIYDALTEAGIEHPDWGTDSPFTYGSRLTFRH